MEKDKIVYFCDRAALFSLYALFFFLPISKALLSIFTYLAIFLVIVKKILSRQELARAKINYGILAYLIVAYLSIFTSSNVNISVRAFLGKVLQNVGLFFAIVETLSTKQRLKNVIYILFASSLLIGIDGIYQYFTHHDFIRNRKYVGKSRIHATFPTPNDFACYLDLVIPFVLVSMFMRVKHKVSKVIPGAIFVLLFACLMLTISRGGWFAFLGLFLFMSMWIRGLGLFLLSLGIIIIFTRQFYYPYLQERMNNFFNFVDPSVMDREKIWGAAWKMFISRPLIGVGLGTFMFNFRKFIAFYRYGTPYAHNCYLQIISEIGILGLSAFLLILGLFFFDGIKLLNTREKDSSWYILLASLAAALGFSVLMIVDTVFYSLDLGVFFWSVLGMGTAAVHILKSRPGDSVNCENK